MKKTLRFLMLAAALMVGGSASAATVRLYKKATVLESGKSYIMVAEVNGVMKVGKPITSNYGYIQVEDGTVTADGITMPTADNDYIITNVGNNYTIKQQSDNRYLYMTGTYNSFNLNASPTEGEQFSFTCPDGDTWTITNVSKNKYIQYRSDDKYKSYGCYASAQSDGVLPQLYVYDKDVDGTLETPEDVANIKALTEKAEGALLKLTLTNAQVLYVNEYNGTKELFIRDASGAMDLYNLGINATAGQVLNGTIIGKRGVNQGFTYALVKDAQTDASTVTVGEAQTIEPVEIESLDEATYDAFGCDLVKLTGVNLNLTDKKAEKDGESLPLYDRFKLQLLSNLDESKTYDVTGLVYDGGTSYGTELVITAITYEGGAPIVEESATAVASIEALRAMENTTNVELTLTDAKVVFNDGNSIYVREGSKAVCFYQVNAVKELFKNNAVVNGKIILDYEVYNLLPEVKANKNTKTDGLTVVESEEEAVPIETTLAKVAEGENVCDLVTLAAKLVREVTETPKADGTVSTSTKYYLVDGDVKLVLVNNSKNLKTLADNGVEDVTVTGVVNTASGAYQIKLTKNAVDNNATSIVSLTDNTDNQTIYNLQGCRVAVMQKGLYIVGGKKYLVK